MKIYFCQAPYFLDFKNMPINGMGGNFWRIFKKNSIRGQKKKNVRIHIGSSFRLIQGILQKQIL